MEDDNEPLLGRRGTVDRRDSSRRASALRRPLLLLLQMRGKLRREKRALRQEARSLPKSHPQHHAHLRRHDPLVSTTFPFDPLLKREKKQR